MLPLANVQQYDIGRAARAQVTYVRDGLSVTCSHFLHPDRPADELTVLRELPAPPGARELSVAAALPDLGQPVQLLWEQQGFRTVHPATVARIEADSFAVFVGFAPPATLQGLSGALCWGGTSALGVVTGCQRRLKHAYLWVSPIKLDQNPPPRTESGGPQPQPGSTIHQPSCSST